MDKIPNKMGEHLVYTLFAIIIASIIGIGYILIFKINNQMDKIESTDDNQYIIIYSDHIHNAPLSVIDVGDDGSHIFRECKRSIDMEGNIVLELKFVEKKNVTLDRAAAELMEEQEK